MRVRRGAVVERGVQALGPLPRSVLLNQVDLTAAGRQAFLAAGRRQERGEGVAAGGRPAATIQQDRQWYKISNSAGGPVVVDIYDEIGYWGVMAAEFQRELSAITATEITVNLNSPGGEIFEGIAIYNALRTHPANITVRVSSLAASIASVIAQAGDRIIMQTGSQMMIHEGSGLCMGDAADMRQMAELLDRQSDNIASIYAERAGGTTEEWRERMQAETWFNAEEAVAAGLANEVEAPARQDQAQPAEPVTAHWDLSVFQYAGREAAPAPVVNTATAVEPPVAPEPAAAPAAVEHPEPQAAEPPAIETPEPAEPPAAPEPDPWAAATAQLLTVPTWDDVTASLREASK